MRWQPGKCKDGTISFLDSGIPTLMFETLITWKRQEALTVHQLDFQALITLSQPHMSCTLSKDLTSVRKHMTCTFMRNTVKQILHNIEGVQYLHSIDFNPQWIQQVRLQESWTWTLHQIVQTSERKCVWGQIQHKAETIPVCCVCCDLYFSFVLHWSPFALSAGHASSVCIFYFSRIECLLDGWCVCHLSVVPRRHWCFAETLGLTMERLKRKRQSVSFRNLVLSLHTMRDWSMCTSMGLTGWLGQTTHFLIYDDATNTQ